MRTTIEVFTFKIRKHRTSDFLSFADEPDLYELLANDENNFTNFIDTNLTGDIEQAQRTVRIPQKVEGYSFHHHNNKARYICGIIETGLYGKEYEIAEISEIPVKLKEEQLESAAFAVDESVYTATIHTGLADGIYKVELVTNRVSPMSFVIN